MYSKATWKELPRPAMSASEPEPHYLCIVPWAAMTKYHKPMGFNTRNVFSHGPGSWKCEIKESIRQGPAEAEGGSIPCSPATPGGLLAPLLLLGSWQHESSLHMASLCVFSMSALHRHVMTQPHGIRAHPGGFILAGPLQRPYFQMRFHSNVLGAQL